MQREDGDLDGERGEEGKRGQPESGGVGGDTVGCGEGREGRQIEGAGAGVEPDHGYEQDGRRDECVEEVLDGGATTVLGTAESGDENNHRDEGQLPEGVVEEEVERDEDAVHRDLKEKEEDVEELPAGVDDAPGGEDAEWREEAGENNEPHGEAINAEVVADRWRGDPGDVLLELEGSGGGSGDVMEGQMQCEQEGDEGHGERPPFHQLGVVRQERQKDRAREWGEGDEGQDGVVDIHLNFR